jgi:hypothetical protein
MAEVCVRVSLQTPSGIEVNYIENILTIHYYFSNGFYTLDEFDVQRPEGMYIVLQGVRCCCYSYCCVCCCCCCFRFASITLRPHNNL